MTPNSLEMSEIAKAVRREVLIRSYRSKLGHLGGTFSVVEILVTLYYAGYIRPNQSSSDEALEDFLFLSKGHACLALYAILNRLGILPQEMFESFGKDGGIGGQLDTAMPGIHWNTGSLGHALGVGAGRALGAKLAQSNARVFAVLGDAEFSEGSIWEAMYFAAEHQLSGLVGIVDRNRLSVTASLGDEGVFANFRDKVEAFGWAYVEGYGHSFSEIQESLDLALTVSQPCIYVANTLKGKGVSFMEGNPDWHHGVPTEDEYNLALAELS